MFVNSSFHKDHPYGSWKDIKNFCQYANKYCGWSSNHPFIEYACKLMEIQLRRDIDFLEMQNRRIHEGAGEGDATYSLSLAGRWALVSLQNSTGGSQTKFRRFTSKTISIPQ